MDAKANYCAFSTNYRDILKEFAFDFNLDFKKFRASHDFVIEQLVVPEEYKNDFENARVYARRKGKIIRKITADGREIVKERDFEA